MVDDNTASIIPLREARRPKTPAERQRAYRHRKRQQRQTAQAAVLPEVMAEVLPNDQQVTCPVTSQANVTPITPPAALPVATNATRVISTGARLVTANVMPVTPATELPVAANVTPITSAAALPVTANVTRVTPDITQVTESRWHATNRCSTSSYGLTAAAFALAGVGLIMNGWFARSLGSTDLAGWLFLAIGVAADLVALTIPSAAAQLWRTRRRIRAAAAWLVCFINLAFVATAGIGFASLNIADVTLARASRVTPAVTRAQDALRDAMTARDRECAGGVGRYCREREQAVTDLRRALDATLNSVAHTADPQTDAAIRIVAWLSCGTLKPTADDFAMLRLVLLALLPQVGGILLMIGRAR
jgi:hypothetical protein